MFMLYLSILLYEMVDVENTTVVIWMAVEAMAVLNSLLLLVMLVLIVVELRLIIAFICKNPLFKVRREFCIKEIQTKKKKYIV